MNVGSMKKMMWIEKKLQKAPLLILKYNHGNMTMVISRSYGGFMEIPAGKFKALCLKIMDDINQNHQEITITKHGRPVAKLVPITAPATTPSLFGCLKGSVLKYERPLDPVGEKDWKLK